MLLEICFKDHKDEFIKKLIHYGRDEEASSDAVQEALLSFIKALVSIYCFYFVQPINYFFF